MGLAVGLVGVGVGLAGRTVPSFAYDTHFSKPPGWAEASTGVKSRRFVAEGETACDLGERAALAALAAAKLEASDLSAIIGACGVMEQPIPSFAALLHRRLGLAGSGVPAFDVNATCLSFLLGLRVAALEIAAGTMERALVVAADVASAALNPDDPETAPLFGDGAAAVVVSRGAGELAAFRMETYSEGAHAAWLGAGGSRLPARNLDDLLAEAHFRMDGPTAFRIASKHMAGFVERLLAEASWSMADIDLVVPHQASGPALELMRRKLGFSPEMVVETLPETGNLVAASLPTALAHAVRSGRAAEGSRLLLIGTGAGISIAGAALRL